MLMMLGMAGAAERFGVERTGYVTVTVASLIYGLLCGALTVAVLSGPAIL